MPATQTTALVTGAAGFVGSHLVDHLLAIGWRVRGLDDFSMGRQENLQAATSAPDFDLIEGSVLDETTTRDALAGVDYVFHLAGRVGPYYVEQHPERTALDTIDGVRNLLTAVRGRRIPMFFASTSEIYGDTDAQPLSEDADLLVPPPANPRSSYALGKGVGELLVNSYIRCEQGPAVIGRLFNCIGPRQSGQYGLVVPRFVRSALTNQPLIIHGSGAQTRSFTSVDDCVRAIAATLASPAAYGHTINIGNSNETSISDLAQLVLRLTGSTSTVSYEPYERVHGSGARDIRRRIPNTEKLRRLANFECTTPLESTIKTILQHDGSPAGQAF